MTIPCSTRAWLPLAVALAAALPPTSPRASPERRPAGRSVAEVAAALEAGAGARVRAALRAAAAPERPTRLWLVGFKDARRLELWAEASGDRRVRVTSWPILAASGGAGPKRREGDLQVPEGVYRIAGLNPASAYHLSLRIDYPNAQDRAWATRDRRARLGGDIYIHGKDVSIGCIAIGDEAVEELFWLAATVGRRAFTVVLVPTDLRRNPAPRPPGVPWAAELYQTLRAELARFPEDRGGAD